jgi:hypothetical protein
MGTGKRVGIGLSYPAHQATQPGGIGSLESILGLLKSLKIRALLSYSTVLPLRSGVGGGGGGKNTG